MKAAINAEGKLEFDVVDFDAEVDLAMRDDDGARTDPIF
jgi:hypothetical protein